MEPVSLIHKRALGGVFEFCTSQMGNLNGFTFGYDVKPGIFKQLPGNASTLLSRTTDRQLLMFKPDMEPG
jgi:hypothetical protein